MKGKVLTNTIISKHNSFLKIACNSILNEEIIFELWAIEVERNKNKVIMGEVYRTSSENVNGFLDKPNKIL